MLAAAGGDFLVTVNTILSVFHTEYCNTKFRFVNMDKGFYLAVFCAIIRQKETHMPEFINLTPENIADEHLCGILRR